MEDTIRASLKTKITVLLLELILKHFLYLDHVEYCLQRKSDLARDGMGACSASFCSLELPTALLSGLLKALPKHHSLKNRGSFFKKRCYECCD